MTTSRKSVLAAVVLFFLIAVTVLGTMAWATAATYQLAKKNVEEEHDSRVQGAMRKIAAHMEGMINSETNRPFYHYFDQYLDRPDSIELNDGRTIDPDLANVKNVKLASPLSKKQPPYAWVELHFQIDPQGRLDSPQIPDESPWFMDRSEFSPEYIKRARAAWFSLEKLYHVTDFRQRVASVFRHEEQRDGDGQVALVRAAGDDASGASPDGATKSASTGEAWLPPGVCVHPELAAQNLRTSPPIVIHDTWSELSDEPVEIEPGQFAPAFWIEPEPVAPRKLAFVREYYADADVFYQGFIGDWELLKAELLEQVRGRFPEANLTPVKNDTKLSGDALSRKLTYLPVVLDVPPIPANAAWQSVGWQLAIIWAAGAAVLMIAGAGVRNLVALTQRRMQFAYAVTHELRTPLTTFRLYSDMLSAGLVPHESQQEYLDTLNRESVRLSKLVEEVLEYARLENQNVRLNVTNTDAPSLLRVVSEPLDRLCSQNGVDGRTFNNIPNGQVIRTDVNLVSQIAGVLVNNACRHARDASRPTVVMTLGTEADRVYLDVIDSGPGIDRSDARKIFRPFRRGRDADRSARGGIGLGLALARNWATLLGGRLDLMARHHPQYNGAHFRLTIPSYQPA